MLQHPHKLQIRSLGLAPNVSNVLRNRPPCIPNWFSDVIQSRPSYMSPVAVNTTSYLIGFYQ